MTARRALEDLALEGYVKRVPGKGTFIKRQQFTQGFFHVHPFKKYAEAHNVRPKTKVLEISVLSPPDEIAEKINCTRAIRVQRLNYFSDEPVRLETRYLRYDLCNGILTQNLNEESIHEVLIYRLNLPLTKVWQLLEAVVLSEDIASLFNVSVGHPAFHMKRITYTFDEPVTWVEYYMRGDCYAFENKFSPQKIT